MNEYLLMLWQYIHDTDQAERIVIKYLLFLYHPGIHFCWFLSLFLLKRRICKFYSLIPTNGWLFTMVY